jgi:hypothetical protein
VSGVAGALSWLSGNAVHVGRLGRGPCILVCGVERSGKLSKTVGLAIARSFGTQSDMSDPGVVSMAEVPLMLTRGAGVGVCGFSGSVPPEAGGEPGVNKKAAPLVEEAIGI